MVTSETPDDAVTRVPVAEFERLVAELEEPPVVNEALRAAAVRAREVIEPRPVEMVWCPCGHGHPDLYLCINGVIYGPCPDENCGGVCEAVGECTSPECACREAL